MAKHNNFIAFSNRFYKNLYITQNQKKKYVNFWFKTFDLLYSIGSRLGAGQFFCPYPEPPKNYAN
jgi:hypothetical protein